MADETKFSDFVNYTAWIDAGILEVLRTTNVMMNFMYAVNLPKGSNSKQLRKRNAQTAAVVAEATPATNAVYSHSAMSTLTAKKIMVLNEISDESILFANMESDEVRTEQGASVSEKVDVDSTALFTGFSQTAGTSGQALDAEVLEDAAYLVSLSNAPGAPVFVLANKQVHEVKKDIITSGSSIWANPLVNNLLDGQVPAANGYRGTFMGYQIFQTNHVPTSGSDRVGACLIPNYALAMAVVRTPVTEVERDSTKRTRKVSTDFYYDVKERLDAAGVGIVSKAA